MAALRKPLTLQTQSPDDPPSLWRLPIELRCMVWTLLARRSRDIYLKLAVEMGPVHQPARIHLELDLQKLDKHIIYPEVLHICSESRLTAQVECLWFYHRSLVQGLSLNTSTSCSGAFLNVTVDRFIICPDLARRPGKSTYFDFKALQNLSNVEIWYDRLIYQFDKEMVTKLLAWVPHQLVIKEVVNPDDCHPLNCVCAKCEDLDYNTDRSEVDRTTKYKEEAEKCQRSLKGYIMDFYKSSGEAACKNLVFKRGMEEGIDWARRERTRQGSGGMI